MADIKRTFPFRTAAELRDASQAQKQLFVRRAGAAGPGPVKGVGKGKGAAQRTRFSECFSECFSDSSSRQHSAAPIMKAQLDDSLCDFVRRNSCSNSLTLERALRFVMVELEMKRGF